MYNETITFYSKNPLNKGVLLEYDIEFWEENRTCGDDLKVYIRFEKAKNQEESSSSLERGARGDSQDTISDWSFQGDTAIITTACASIFGESIVGMTAEEVLTKDYSYIVELIESEVSERRKQAAVLGLLTTRNAIHTYLQDGVLDTFDDVILQ